MSKKEISQTSYRTDVKGNVRSLLHSTHLEFLGELGLIASVLLGYYFLMLLIEIPHLRERLIAPESVALIDTTILMSCIIFVMYGLSIPLLIARVVLLSNEPTLRTLAMLGAPPEQLAARLVKWFVRLMVRVSIKAFAIEFVVYAVLVMTVSAFTNAIYINFLKVVALSLVSALVFTAFAVAVLWRQASKFVQRFHEATDDPVNS